MLRFHFLPQCIFTHEQMIDGYRRIIMEVSFGFPLIKPHNPPDPNRLTDKHPQFLKELDDKPPPRISDGRPRPTHARTASTPLGWRSHPTSPAGRASPDERTPLARSYSTADLDGANEMEYTGQGPVAGGTIMGIHNLAIVFPQFIASLILPPFLRYQLIVVVVRSFFF